MSRPDGSRVGERPIDFLEPLDVAAGTTNTWLDDPFGLDEMDST